MTKVRSGPSLEEIEEISRWHEEDRRLKRLAEKASWKTIDQILADVERLYEVYIPEIDGKIRYKKLTQAEYLEIAKIEDPEVFAQEMLFRMWRKGDPNVTLEKVKKLPFDLVITIQNRIHEATPFLHIEKVGEALKNNPWLQLMTLLLRKYPGYTLDKLLKETPERISLLIKGLEETESD